MILHCGVSSEKIKQTNSHLNLYILYCDVTKPFTNYQKYHGPYATS